MAFKTLLSTKALLPTPMTPMSSLPTTRSESCSRTDSPFRRGEEGQHRAKAYSDVLNVQAQGFYLKRKAKALEKVAALKKVAQIQGSVKERAGDNRVELLSRELALTPAESSRVRQKAEVVERWSKAILGHRHRRSHRSIGKPTAPSSSSPEHSAPCLIRHNVSK
jgi:hypothetical protein